MISRTWMESAVSCVREISRERYIANPYLGNGINYFTSNGNYFIIYSTGAESRSVRRCPLGETGDVLFATGRMSVIGV